MQTVLNPEYKTGIFKQELKNRFLCEVEIDGVSTVCYVPSSCHLSNFLKLKGKKVLLLPTQSKDTRTKYALFAVPFKKSHIILNSSLANKVVENNIHSRRFSFLGQRSHVIKEHYINGYKSDLFIQDTNTIIEIKSVISTEKLAFFPTVFSERSINQFGKILLLLKNGYSVHYCIVSLSPYVNEIHILKNTPFSDSLKKCIEKGMTISAFSSRLKEGHFDIDKRIFICID